MRLVTLLTVLAWIKFIVLWVVFLFLPAMALETSILLWTAVLIVIDELSWTPVYALIFRIDIELGLPPKILPVVGKYALIPLMIVLVVGTPNSLEMKHVKVLVRTEFVYQFHRYLWFWVGERTIITVFTFTCAVSVGGTKLRLVFVGMVKLFNSIMSLLASFLFGTFFPFWNLVTHFWLIWAERSSLVFLLVMVKWTSFKVVAVWIYLARTDFE